jgi:protein-export membrane protein SecD
MSGQKWRLILTLAMVVIACVAFWNTFKLWNMSAEEQRAMQESDPGALQQLQQKAIRLGLDLQGGIHVVLRVKMEELDEAGRASAVERAMQIIRTRIDGLGVAEPLVHKQGNDRIVVELPGYTDANRAEDLIGQTALLEFKLMETYEDATLLLNRIDSVIHATTVTPGAATAATPSPSATEPETAKDSSRDLLTEMMGDSAKKDTGDFEFDENLGAEEDTHPLSSRLAPSLYSQNTRTNWPGFDVDKADKAKIEKWLSMPEVQAVIPVDVQFAWSTRSSIRESREVWELHMLKRKVQFLGKYLQDISIGRGQYGGYTVNFRVTGDGMSRFAQLTGANINKPLVVVIDNRVESAAFINSKIRGQGEITMGTGSTVDDARNLEIVLEAGALPAPVEIIEKNVVGASLGTDSINKGFTASMIGLILVLLFVGVYYRISGVIANIGLLFNIFFLLAVMAGLGATLTMPGIAGIILTIGISVDSNILIFERIREELRSGKTIRASIDAGYERAFVAIFDSHVTTLITAGALFIFGAGPIKGFAVTLFWGVTLSLYTAYVITKSIFDIRKGYQSLSI